MRAQDAKQERKTQKNLRFHWAENGANRKSSSGHLFKYIGDSINEAYKKQDCVALSSTEEKCIALAETCKKWVWLGQLICDHDRYHNQKCAFVPSDNLYMEFFCKRLLEFFIVI